MNRAPMVDRRRDQDAECRAGRHAACDPAFRVVLSPEGREGHGADGGRRGNRRSRDRGKNGRGHDIGMQQTARQGARPVGNRAIHALRHAATHKDLAHEDEKRDRHQQKVVERPPHHRPEGADHRIAEEQVGPGQGDDEKRRGDVQADEKQKQQQAKAQGRAFNPEHCQILPDPRRYSSRPLRR